MLASRFLSQQVLVVAVIAFILSFALKLKEAPNLFFASPTTKGIEEVLGEAWIPRESELPSEYIIQYPVAFDPEGSGARITPSFLRDGDPLKETLRNRTTWGKGIDITWWEDPSEETATDIWRQLAWRIWKDHPLMQDAVGIEYWTNIVKQGLDLDWHVDMDTHMWVTHQKLVVPTWGAVYYGYPHQFRGGYLELMVGGVNEEWSSHVGGELERLRADYNRLIVFNASKWHRVSPVTSQGDRITFAANLWHTRPSMENFHGHDSIEGRESL
jgi:hypothetical protein